LSQRKTGYKFLFIENSPEACDRIRSVFEKAGGDRLLFAASPATAIEIVGRETVDAVFVNPGQYAMNARECIQPLAQAAGRVPVIVMSPQVNEETVLEALQAGAFECVPSGEPDAYPAVAFHARTRFKIAQDQGKDAEAILRSQKQWMSIIDAITDYIFVLDGAHTLVRVNHAFAAAIGKHPRDIVGAGIAGVFDLPVPDESTRTAVQDDSSPRTYENKIGEELYQISIFPLQEGDRRLTIHVMKNITEVRRLKDRLYHADKLASVGLLVSGVAHEINNPLTGTIAYSELLLMKVTDDGIRSELKKILDSAERCKKIVDNLLTFSRQRTPSKSLESINDIIDRAVDLRSYWLRSNNIQIVREYDPVSTVFIDAQQIQQVILNLVLNAEQAITGTGQANGMIRFTTRYDKDTRRVSIRVGDSGPGIPQKVSSKIFDPFFTTKPVGIGTGLGLSIAHGIITEHGGTISFHNAEGGGAVFTIELPTGAGALLGTPNGKESERIR